MTWTPLSEQEPPEDKPVFFSDGRYIWIGKMCYNDDSEGGRIEFLIDEDKHPYFDANKKQWVGHFSWESDEPPTHWCELPTLPE